MPSNLIQKCSILYTIYRRKMDKVSSNCHTMDKVRRKLPKQCWIKRTHSISSTFADWTHSSLGTDNFSLLREKVRFPGTETLTPLRPWPQTGPCQACPWTRIQNLVPFVFSSGPPRKPGVGVADSFMRRCLPCEEKSWGTTKPTGSHVVLELGEDDQMGYWGPENSPELQSLRRAAWES